MEGGGTVVTKHVKWVVLVPSLGPGTRYLQKQPKGERFTLPLGLKLWVVHPGVRHGSENSLRAGVRDQSWGWGWDANAQWAFSPSCSVWDPRIWDAVISSTAGWCLHSSVKNLSFSSKTYPESCLLGDSTFSQVDND